MINRSESELIARERRNQALRRPQGGRIAEKHPFERAASRKAGRRGEQASVPEPGSAAESRTGAGERRRTQK